MPDPVSGVKAHYTGGYVNPDLLSNHSMCDDAVRGIQNGHMDGNGWIDIGYSFIVCHHRYVYVGRGLRHLPAANGPGLNSGHYAILGLVGSSGLTKPSEDLLEGIRDTIDYIQEETSAGKQIRGHRDGYATSCPGEPLYRWIKEGAPRHAKLPLTPTPEESMIVVSLGRVGSTLIPEDMPYQPWWTDEYSDLRDAHPEGGQSIAPSEAMWGDFTTHLFFEGVSPSAFVEVSFVRTLKDGTTHDVPAGPFRFYPDFEGKVSTQLSAKFKLDATKRARVQVKVAGSDSVRLTDASSFKAYLFNN